MDRVIRLHDVVALLEDAPCSHFETGRALMLRRGQIGTVVMLYDPSAAEVEFSGRDGKPYALVLVPVEKLMLLHDTPYYVAA